MEMASSKEYMQFILEQLSGLEDVRCRPMMGEYLLYYRGKLAGGIYDNRLLVKPTPAAATCLPHAPREVPYPGAREMLLVEIVENREQLEQLFRSMESELPQPKPGKRRR